MSGLKPTVTGALITSGFAVVGCGASAVTTAATLRTSRTAAQDQRLWEKRASFYEELVAAAKGSTMRVHARMRDLSATNVN
jgi:hypothetical protein